MNNKEVAHLWANQSRERASGSHFYFEGDTIYSYGSHFPIARHYKGAVLFTSNGRSVTTARHKNITRSACSHLQVFYVANPLRNPGREFVNDYAAHIKELIARAGRARNVAQALEGVERAVNEANQFCEQFGFKTRFEMPDNIDELRAKAKASAERERNAKAAREAKFERECAEIVQRWLAGESVQVPGALSKVYLRTKSVEMPVNGEATAHHELLAVMETSKGARVALTEAEKAFRFASAMRERGWKRNGDQFKVGDYALDAVNEQGVVAGCHRIGWDEIERFAATQGWL